MLLKPLASGLTCLLLATQARSQYVVESLSFGHKDTLSPNLRAIPGWHLSGEKHTPQILSDRVVLTPPAPGSARGALWADAGITHQEWQLEIDFRASGQERGSGNLQIWYIKDGRSVGGMSSIYTIGKTWGGIRGFLNDGSLSYKDHHAVDSLAFGHCDFNYRNLGRPSKLRVVNGHDKFSVLIDDRICFSSDKVKLPNGYFVGASAASAENPDSFEIMKFVTSTTASVTREEPVPARKHLEKVEGIPENFANSFKQHLPDAPLQQADVDAAAIKSQEEQFADLHNRLQGLTHQVANIFGEFDRLAKTLNDRHSELSAKLGGIPGHEITALSRRIENIERTVQTIQRDVEGTREYKQSLTNLQQAVEGVKGGLTEHLPNTLSQIVSTSTPGMGRFVWIIIGFQVVLAAAYVAYKRRRANSHEKYL
ncbi:hypothetical protein H2203_004450 [Taxawa tesnikishii (nom. ined.)]|nr:hypothetical protein H2203_004450 [Dothideales sp. JES 119]